MCKMEAQKEKSVYYWSLLTVYALKNEAEWPIIAWLHILLIPLVNK